MEKVWLKNYPAHVPAEATETPYRSLGEFFLASCDRYSDKPAIQSCQTRISYQTLQRQAQQFAAYLQKELGMQTGERIGIMLPNLIQQNVAMFGALLAGLVVVNINPLYKADELAHQLKDSGTKTLIVLDHFTDIVEMALPQTDIESVIVTGVGDALPGAKRTLINFILRYTKRKVAKHSMKNVLTYRNVMARGAKFSLDVIEQQKDDLAFLQYTSGTTGRSKGVMLTHGNILANMQQFSDWAGDQGETIFKVTVTALPLYHIFSLTMNGFATMLYGGLSVLIPNPRDTRALSSEIAGTGFSVFMGVNTLFNLLLHCPNFCKLDFSSLIMSGAGGMALQESVSDEWMKVTNSRPIQAYGLTETSPLATVNHLDNLEYTSSIGLPIGSTEVKVLQADGSECGFNEPGELLLRGPQVTKGYWQNSDATREALTDDGWLHTGDVVVMNEQGYINIVDRLKDMILVSGFNVSPSEVEAAIAAHPDVFEAAVVGIEDEESGERVKAFVVRKNSALTEDILSAWCHENLAGYKTPKVIEFRDELPKNTVGKILRRVLRNNSD